MAITVSITSERAGGFTEGSLLKEQIVTYSVEGLTTTLADWPSQAMDRNIVGAGLPAAWSQLPTYPTMRLVRYSSEGVSGQHAFVNCHFVNTAIEVVRGGSGLEFLQTDQYPVDNPAQGVTAGDDIFVIWDGVNSGVSGVSIFVPEEEQKQPGVITATDVQSTVIVTRIEPDIAVDQTAGIKPWEKAEQYTNKTNSTPWLGKPEETWLCEDVQYDPNGMDRIAWLMTYTFRYRPRGWEQEAVYIQRSTGEPAPTLVAGVGRKTIKIQDPVSFTQLGFTFAA